MNPDNKYIFFDFDGTIADSLEYAYKAYSFFMQKIEKTPTITEFNSLNGPSLREVMIILKQKYNLPFSIDTMLSDYFSQLENIYYNEIKPFDDVYPTLEYLSKKQIPMAIVSSNQKKIIKNFLIKYNLSNYFKFLITSENIKKSKPFPDIYLFAKQNIPNNYFAIAVEDSENGIISAKKAGLSAVLIDRFGKSNAEYDYKIQNLQELLNLI